MEGPPVLKYTVGGLLFNYFKKKYDNPILLVGLPAFVNTIEIIVIVVFITFLIAKFTV